MSFKDKHKPNFSSYISDYSDFVSLLHRKFLKNNSFAKFKNIRMLPFDFTPYLTYIPTY